MMDHSLGEEALEPVVESFLMRFRAGERPSIEDYARRHPDLAEALREVLPMLVAVERDLTVDRGPASTYPATPGMPTRLGDYRILREIGRGGMGVVYEAVQQSLGRHVALKVLPRSAAPTSALERFRLEARSAARLHHTNIVPVFGVGEEDGVHFFAMQFIRGQGLDQVIAELRHLRALPSTVHNDASVAARLAGGRFSRAEPDPQIAGVPGKTGPKPGPDVDGAGDRPSPSRQRPRPGRAEAESGGRDIDRESDVSSLVSDRSRSDRLYFDGVARIALQVAEALSYSHAQGILHRDIKPSNILLDTRGTAWVTDFGLAKAEEGTGPTQPGDILGTLRYMAPERFEGVSDPRSDVYALGTTLYELLTLRPAFEGGDRPRLVEQILHREPTPPRAIDPRVPLDLEVICLKCLAKEPGARYASAEQLAADLGRFLGGQSILARRIGSSERAWRWCRRNPAMSGLIAALAVTLVVGIAGVASQWLEARDQRDEARIAARRASLEATRAKQAARRERDARTAESATRLEAERLAARTALARGQSLADRGAVAQGIHWMAAALRQTPPGDSPFERLVRRNLASYGDVLARVTNLLPDEPSPKIAALGAHGSVLATVIPPEKPGGLYVARFWDVSTGRRIGPEVRGASIVSLSPDGRLAACVGTTTRYIEVATGRPIFQPTSVGACHGVNFTADGSRIAEFGAVGAKGGFVRILDATTGTPIGRPLLFDAWVHHADFRPDGRAISVLTRDEGLSLWSLEPGQEPRPLARMRLHGTYGNSHAAFDPGGRWLAAWSMDGGAGLRFWDARTGRLLPRRIPLGDRPALRLSYSPDGRLLLALERGGVVRIRDAETDRLIAYPIVRVPEGSRLDFLPSGDAFLALPTKNRAPIRRVDLTEQIVRTTILGTSDLDAPGSSAPVGGRLAEVRGVAAFDKSLGRAVVQGKSVARILDLDEGRPLGEPIRLRWQAPGPVAVAPDGATFSAVMNNASGPNPGTVDCRVELRDLATGTLRCPPFHPVNSVVAIDFSPDSRSFVTGDFGDLVQVWDVTTGRRLGPPIPQENIVWSVAYSPDATRLAVGTHVERRAGHAGVTIWDLASRRPVGPPARHRPETNVERILWSRDGSRVASFGAGGGELMLLDGHTAAVIARTSDFLARPIFLAPGADDDTLLVGTSEGAVELRDARTLSRFGRPLTPPDALLHRLEVSAVACSPDGQTIAAGYPDGTIRTWDVGTRLPCGPPLRHDCKVQALVFRDGGRKLTSISVDGEVRSWPVREPLEGPADLIALRLEVETGMALRPSEDVEVLSGDAVSSRTHTLAERLSSHRFISSSGTDPGRIERDARFAEHRAQWPAALYQLGRLQGSRPDDPMLRVRRAVALAALNRIEEAEAELTRALRIDGREAGIDLLIHRALEARDAGHLQLASWALGRAAELRPEDWRLLVDRADVRRRLGDIAGRETDLMLAVARGADALFLSRRADELDIEGRTENAHQLRILAVGRISGGADGNLLRSLAAGLVRRGDLVRSAELLSRIESDGTSDVMASCYLRALLALALRDQAAYRSRCAEAMAVAAKRRPPWLANDVAWICVLGPSATEDPEQVVSLARRALEGMDESERHVCLNTLGAALHRAGRHSEAIERIEEGIRLRGGRVSSQDRAFLTLAYHALGDQRMGRCWLEGGDLAGVSDWDALEIRVLKLEAWREILDPPFPADPFAALDPDPR